MAQSNICSGAREPKFCEARVNRIDVPQCGQIGDGTRLWTAN
jgi:hypothetical protein